MSERIRRDPGRVHDSMGEVHWGLASLGVGKGQLRCIFNVQRFWCGIGRIRGILTADIHTTISTKHVERSAGTQEQ